MIENKNLRGRKSFFKKNFAAALKGLGTCLTV
jgi:hypothetical protein